MQEMRKVSITAIAAVAALTLAGCAGETAAPEAETGDIRVWLVGTDTPQEARDYLKTTFEAENPGSTLTIEEQRSQFLPALQNSITITLITVGEHECDDMVQGRMTSGLVSGAVKG